MAIRLPIVGLRGAYLAPRPNGWALVQDGLETPLCCRILTQADVTSALGPEAYLETDCVRILGLSAR